MTSALSAAEFVRITVHGPVGQADLAVPVSTSVADLMPVLLQHTTDPSTGATESLTGNGWVLQRLGGPPLDQDGTPESLDWLHGDQFHLRPAGDTLPELDFDDIADGMATAVSGQPDRWRPELSRWLFLGIAAVAVFAVVRAVASVGVTAGSVWSAGGLAAGFAVAAVTAGRLCDDRALVVLLGLSSAAFAWVAGVLGADPAASLVHPGAAAALAGGLAVTAVAGVVLGGRSTLAPDVPMLPFAVLAVVGVTLTAGTYLHLALGHRPASVVAVLSTVYLGALMFAPRLVLRIARLNGPQLPRTAEDLQEDTDPLPADQVIRRTALADRFLSVLAIGTAAVLCAAFPVLLAEPGWAPVVLVGLCTVTAGLRARVHLTVAQRLALAAAGGFGGVLLAQELARAMPGIDRLMIVLGLVVVIGVAVAAALRPASRRLRPVWGHVANIVETVTALAIIPVLLQVLGAYAFARGLAG
jgi:type VII secretion integral membrane protein EccD